MRRIFEPRVWATMAIVLAGAALATTVAGQQPVPKVAEPPVPKVADEAAIKTAVKAPAKPAAPVIEARAIFGALATPAPLSPRAIGFYSHGCLAGAEPLPIDGPVWQVMRLSRNRNWGHPNLVKMIERLAGDAKAQDGWPGLLVGDLSQPRGGPMVSSHASHQVGLDVDVWLTPMPDHRLTAQEREDLSAGSVLGPDELSVDPNKWTPALARVIVRAASYPEVDRMFVHPAIKKALCLEPGIDRANLRKIQPYYGHEDHMHIRIACPKDSALCKPQIARPADDGCAKEVDQWLANFRKAAAIAAARPKLPPPPVPAKPVPRRPGLSLAQLPAECRAVVDAGAPGTLAAAIAKIQASSASATGTAIAPVDGAAMAK